MNNNSMRIGYTTIDYYEEKKAERNRFICEDIFGVMNDIGEPCDSIIMVCQITTDAEHRLKGSAKEAMMQFAEIHKDKIIATQSAPLVSEFPTQPTAKEHIEALQRQAVFLEAIGFRNTNVLHGFGESIGYVYKNDTAKPLISRCIIAEIGYDFKPSKL